MNRDNFSRREDNGKSQTTVGSENKRKLGKNHSRLFQRQKNVYKIFTHKKYQKNKPKG
jgi:hypothetical protein